jgi:hypothetical protein
LRGQIIGYRRLKFPPDADTGRWHILLYFGHVLPQYRVSDRLSIIGKKKTLFIRHHQDG